MKWTGDSTHPFQSPTPTVNGFGLTPLKRTQTSEQEYKDLMARNRRTSAQISEEKLLKPFSCNPVASFFEVDKASINIFGILVAAQFLETSLENENVVCTMVLSVMA